MAHIRQSGPDSGLGVEATVLVSLGSGHPPPAAPLRRCLPSSSSLLLSSLEFSDTHVYEP